MGLTNENIPGSRFVRGYCNCCGEPIRVHPTINPFDVFCADCDKTRRGQPGKRHMHYSKTEEIEPSPWSENAVRYLEES